MSAMVRGVISGAVQAQKRDCPKAVPKNICKPYIIP